MESRSGPDRRVLLAGALALAGSFAAGAAPAPLRLRRGINLWPWFSLTREFPAPRIDYDWPPFQPERPTPSDADLASLAAAGFDFVRIPVDPGPFLAFRGAQRASLLAELAAAVRRAQAAGLSVVVNLQANAATHHYRPDALYGGPSAPLLPAFRELLAEVARRLTALDPARGALEPVNEPPQGCGAGAWDAVQRILLAEARRAAPTVTLVATGACGSMAPGLTALDPTPWRAFAPVLFTFHFYEPYLFTHQGATWMTGEPFYRALNSVPWPGSAGRLDETLAAVRARMRDDAGTSAEAKAEAYRQTEAKLREYFAASPDRGYLARGLADVRTWAELYGIAPGEILLGEFGALRSDATYVASHAPDRARYVRDVREAAEAAGFAWAFWNYFDGFGLTRTDAAPSAGARSLDPALIDALGLRMPPGAAAR
ncbi:cellulase family glycosylhydrolase [Methylobacterium sp. A54F]